MRIDRRRIHGIESAVPCSRSESHERTTVDAKSWHPIADCFFRVRSRQLNRSSQGLKDAPDRLRLCPEIGIDAAGRCWRVGSLGRRVDADTSRGTHRGSFSIESERRTAVTNEKP
jgi:hypothetical protein